MAIRRVFYSFHYQPDNWRAAQVRNIGVIDGNQPARDNDWESVKKAGNAAIEQWIAAQMHGRSCTVVLTGSATANRKWINHEIVKSWDAGMGVVAIRIHGLKDATGSVAPVGANPLDFITHGKSGKKLSTIAKCYTPTGPTSTERYDWIKRYLADAVEEAIAIRRAN